MLPITFLPEKSDLVREETMKFIIENWYENELSDYFWLYQSIWGLIPQTMENLWSWHIQPYKESFEELQISYNLNSQWFYKQALVSLRSVIEIWLLSVYWNLQDDGHIVIKEWVSSKENTPRFEDIWNKISKYENFKLFQSEIDLKSRLLWLSKLHNYVHSKGFKYSNTLWKMKNNCQTFEEKGFKLWLFYFQEVIEILTIIHLIKYPLWIIDFDYGKKFWIDIPGFPQLHYSLHKLEKIIWSECFNKIIEISEKDKETQRIMSWVTAMPDMKDEESEKQIMDYDKRDIEQHWFKIWYTWYKSVIDLKWEEYYKYLKKWAIDNNVYTIKDAWNKRWQELGEFAKDLLKREEKFDNNYWGK